ncbi:hypothetical protein EON64_20165, partial [archaeon]
TLDNVELNPIEGVLGFKRTIRELTNVPEERQKLMGKGLWTGTLKDDFDFTTCNINDGAQVMLIGTADSVAVPVEKTTFIEDMSIDEIAQKGGVLLPAGLENLGNTCYLNSTLQCLRRIPQLREVLQQRTNPSPLSNALLGVLGELDRSGKAIVPYSFIAALRASYPQFAEMQHGRYAQQDAEELYNAIITTLDPHTLHAHHLLMMEVEESLVCKEAEELAPTRRDMVNKLVCNIQGGVDSTVQV